MKLTCTGIQIGPWKSNLLRKASGAHVTDIDGNVLVDFVQSWGPLIHGHSHPEIIEAVHEKMLNGTSFGAPHLGEIELAKKVKKRFRHMDKVRFVSSGTEAVMSAVRLARGYTGRDLLVKFEGCYHGHVDSLMVSSGSGLATFGIASSRVFQTIPLRRRSYAHWMILRQWNFFS